MFLTYDKIMTPGLISLLSIGKIETKKLPFVSHEDYNVKKMDVKTNFKPIMEQHVYFKRVHVVEDLLFAMLLKIFIAIEHEG
jgi:hypothetical protein